jgi:C1A family cysteine protease
MKLVILTILKFCLTHLEFFPEFIQYGVTYKKDYHLLKPEEIINKYETFKTNLNTIKSHKGNYQIGVTPFTDIPLNKLKEKYLSDFSEYIKKPSEPMLNEYMIDIYEPIDWRNKDILLPVRDQKDCGGCWAFSTVGTIEAIKNLQQGVSSYLSPQQLIDCDKADKGCKGGWPSIAYKYTRTTGVVEDSVYPYIAQTSQCETNIVETSTIFKTKGLKSCEEDECMKNGFIYNILKDGPVSVVIDAYHSKFFNYKSGYYDEECSEPNHAIILVGYGYNPELKIGYWIIRNSWGDKWGMNGYGYVKHDDKNVWSCNITRYGFQPVL